MNYIRLENGTEKNLRFSSLCSDTSFPDSEITVNSFSLLSFGTSVGNSAHSEEHGNPAY